MKTDNFLLISSILLSINFSTCSGNDNDLRQDKKDTSPKEIYTINTIPVVNNRLSVLIFDSSSVNAFIDSFQLFLPLKNDLEEFYRKRSYSYVWFDDKGLIEPAFNLYNKIINIKYEGLPDNILYKVQLNELIDKYRDSDAHRDEILDIMLSAQYLSFAKIAWQGLSKNQILSLNWLLPRKETNVSVLLDYMIRGRYILDDDPVFYQYNLLKRFLKKYYDIQNQGGFIKILNDNKTYFPGDSAPNISRIRTYLFTNNDIIADNHSQFYDSTIRTGIKNYQRRMGLSEKDMISPELINHMNISVKKRIEQIIVNMERCRWIPLSTDGDFILINIPDFKLHLYENDSLLWSMKIIAGKNQNQTVVFSGRIKHIVFCPYWNVPPGILKKEILPALSRNKYYLINHDMEWHDGNVRQRPGPNNALGLIKFVFPNTHSIYMHDTPAKSLFKEDKRAFSHGCIRLEEPKKLALYLLRNDDRWNETLINEAMNSGREQFVPLKKEMPVYISYFTCWVDRYGKINFRNDVYEKDGRLAKMILEKPVL